MDVLVYSDISRISPVHRFVLNEMVQTERDYVKDLGVIVEVCHRYMFSVAHYRFIKITGQKLNSDLKNIEYNVISRNFFSKLQRIKYSAKWLMIRFS